MGPDSSVGIESRYGLDGPGIESRWWARFSAPVQTGPVAHPPSCTMVTGSFLGVKRPGRVADHPPLSKRRGHERVGLYLYSPSGLQLACCREILYVSECVCNNGKSHPADILKTFVLQQYRCFLRCVSVVSEMCKRHCCRLGAQMSFFRKQK